MSNEGRTIIESKFSVDKESAFTWGLLITYQVKCLLKDKNNGPDSALVQINENLSIH